MSATIAGQRALSHPLQQAAPHLRRRPTDEKGIGARALIQFICQEQPGEFDRQPHVLVQLALGDQA